MRTLLLLSVLLLAIACSDTSRHDPAPPPPWPSLPYAIEGVWEILYTIDTISGQSPFVPGQFTGIAVDERGIIAMLPTIDLSDPQQLLATGYGNSGEVVDFGGYIIDDLAVIYWRVEGGKAGAMLGRNSWSLTVALRGPDEGHLEVKQWAYPPRTQFRLWHATMRLIRR